MLVTATFLFWQLISRLDWSFDYRTCRGSAYRPEGMRQAQTATVMQAAHHRVMAQPLGNQPRPECSLAVFTRPMPCSKLILTSQSESSSSLLRHFLSLG
jgi:hypothetical protein